MRRYGQTLTASSLVRCFLLSVDDRFMSLCSRPVPTPERLCVLLAICECMLRILPLSAFYGTACLTLRLSSVSTRLQLEGDGSEAEVEEQTGAEGEDGEPAGTASSDDDGTSSPARRVESLPPMESEVRCRAHSWWLISGA